MVNSTLENGNRYREPEWTESIAIGSKNYIESIKTQMGFRAMGRKILKQNGVHQLRGKMGTYPVNFGNEMDSIGIKNTNCWDDNHRISEDYRGPTL